MSREFAIQCYDLGKRYRIGESVRKAKTFKQAVRKAALAPFGYLRMKLRPPSESEILWALRHVSFEVARGEVVGIIGANGAGKSTLLKILSHITEPTEGHAVIRGRVNSLLEVGTGFHPELTGRENVFMAAAIHGMKRAEVNEVFDQIVDFSGVSRFLDTPLKRYSSGMRVRLGFAVAAHLSPDVLIVDEVLAVGDLSFKKRCADRMEKASNSGTTVLVVSHRMESILTLCNRAILLEAGRKVKEGSVRDVVDEYTAGVQIAASTSNLRERLDRRGSGLFRYVDVRFSDGDGGDKVQATVGESFSIHLGVEGPSAPAPDLTCICSLNSITGEGHTTLSSHRIGCEVSLEGRTELEWHIPRMPLPPGEYRCNLFVCRNTPGTPQMELFDRVTDAFTFDVVAGDYYNVGMATPQGTDRVFVDHALRIHRAR